MEKNITLQEARTQYKENKGRVVAEETDGFVVLRGINKVYDNHVQAVYDFNLSIERNEFIVLVGPSGCGKSTTLRMIAGLEEITSGYLYIDGVLANHLESKDRDIAMVFQSYALYPNMTVYDNIGFGLAVRRMPKEEIRQKVFEAAEILDLGPYLDRKPRELSGGQMQRVALGRAIVRNAKLFLMDEPLSNLDAKLRVQMRSEIVKLHKRISATTVYVTHDQTEAMTMADRIVVMNKGFVQQIGTPSEIYSEPANVFVATFIGSPPMNVFRTKMRDGAIWEGESGVTLPAGTDEAFRAFVAQKIAYFGELKERCEAAMKEAVAQACEAFGASSKRGETLTAAYESGAWRTVIRFLKKCAGPLMEEERAVAASLQQAGSAEAFVKKEEAAVPEKKRKRKEEKPDLHTQNIGRIEAYLKAYESAAAESELFVGIRPEHIHLADEFKGAASEPFTAVADFVELLGSELCVYFNAFGSRLICKLSADRLIRMGEEVRLCFDMEKLKLFDGVGGMRIVKQ